MILKHMIHSNYRHVYLTAQTNYLTSRTSKHSIWPAQINYRTSKHSGQMNVDVA